MPQLLFQFQNSSSRSEPDVDNLIQMLNQHKISYDKVQKHDNSTVGVDFSSPEEAKRTYKTLDGTQMMGSYLTIKPVGGTRNKFGGYSRRRQYSGKNYGDYQQQHRNHHDQNYEDVYDNREYSHHNHQQPRYNEQIQYNGHYNPMQSPPPQLPPQQNLDQYPCRILIPSEMVKVVLGKAGATINSIQSKTNSKIDIHRDKGAGRTRQLDDTITTIKGNPQSFTDSIKEILTCIHGELEKLESDEKKPLQLKLLAHDLLCGRIIGKGGNNLKQLKQETGVTKLIISNSLYEEGNQFLPGGMLCTGERVITIEGTIDTISAAEERISKKLRDYMEKDIKNSGNSGLGGNMVGSSYYPGGGSSSASGMNNGYMNAYPPQMMYQRHPYAYANQYGYMGFPAYPEYMGGPTYPGILGHGYPPYGGNLIPQPQNNDVTETTCVFIPTKEVGAVIGRNGDYISRVKGYSGAQVRVVKGEEGAESRVEITGPPDAQWRAALCIFSKIKETMKVPYSEAQLKTEYMVPGTCVGRIIGKKGQVVQDIQDKAQTDIEVPKDKQGGDDVPVFITGTFNGTQIALNRIRDIVQRAQAKSS